jgi:transcriptional regulator with XRE-family HTH domain
MGLSIEDLADALEMTGNDPGRTIRRWESGKYDIPGPTAIAMRHLAECEGRACSVEHTGVRCRP